MFDLIVIGGGPVGLNTALEFSKRKKVLIIEAEDFLGGQISKLYPMKEIVDLSFTPSIIAKDYIDKLVKECKENKNIEIHLNEKAVALNPSENGVIIVTNKQSYEAKDIVISIGLGASSPRPMGVENENKCTNILYSLKDLSTLKNKEVLVLGGGDSALDWTKEISKISEHVTIIHRRREFRGDFNTIKDIKNVIVKTPYVPFKIEYENNLLTHLVIKNVETEELETLKADYVFVNYGNIPMVEHFNLDTVTNGLVVNQNFETSMKHVYAIGDVARYENKKNRIQPALNDLTKLLTIIK